MGKMDGGLPHSDTVQCLSETSRGATLRSSNGGEIDMGGAVLN